MTFLQISTVCKKFCFCWSVCSMIRIIIFLYNICKYLISIVFFTLIFPQLFFCRLFHHFMEIWSFLLIFSFSWNSKTICPNFIDQKQLYSSAFNFLSSVFSDFVSTIFFYCNLSIPDTSFWILVFHINFILYCCKKWPLCAYDWKFFSEFFFFVSARFFSNF